MIAPTKHELALLRMLAAGEGFETACLALKDEGVRAAFQCVLKGWAKERAGPPLIERILASMRRLRKSTDVSMAGGADLDRIAALYGLQRTEPDPIPPYAHDGESDEELRERCCALLRGHFGGASTRVDADGFGSDLSALRVDGFDPRRR